MVGNKSTICQLQELLSECNTAGKIDYVKGAESCNAIVSNTCFKKEAAMNQMIDSLVREVNDWLTYQSFKYAQMPYKNDPSNKYTMLNRKNNYLEAIFQFAQSMFPEMNNCKFIVTYEDIR